MRQMKVGVDTSCLVPLISSWHEYHEPTVSALESLRTTTDLVVAAHSLLECFAVLTRLPERIRITSREALQRLNENFASNFQVIGIDPDACWSAIRHLSDRDLRGGLVYDAIIAYSCARAGATMLLTWDVQDFMRVAPPGLRIQDPLS
jgi:predicted nucleic acid-binding protein